jgi:ATP-dependent DNA helicase RecG
MGRNGERPFRGQLPAIGFGESDQIDFKVSWGDEALHNLASFANTRGGTIYVGVDDRGRLVGTDVSDRQQRLIADQVRSSLRLSPDVRVENDQGVNVIAVQVPASPQPVLLRGSYWIRSGTSSVKAAPEQWAGLVLGQMGRSWDTLPGGQIEDVDEDAVRRFVREAKSQTNPRLPPDVPDDAPIEVILTTLRLLVVDRSGSGQRQTQVTNAALLLFGKDPQRTLPMARVRVARFHGNDQITEHPAAVGTVFEQIDAVVRAVDEYNPVHMTISDSTSAADSSGAARREERRTYPPLAVREVIVNAVVHRDYLAPGDVQVRVLDDRVEVWNPGGLQGNLTVGTLLRRPHPSIPRNPLIAAAAYVARLFEGWGTGTTRIIDLCLRAGLPAPGFSEVAGGFSVTLFGDRLTPERLALLGLNERQLRAVAYLRERGRITSLEYQRLTAAPRTTAVRDFGGLVASGLIERRGSGRGAHYVLAGNGGSRNEPNDPRMNQE